MKKYIIVVFCFTFSTLLSKAQTNSFQKLVWSDEFNHTDVNPDSTKWNYDKGNGCPQLCGWGNNEKEFYTASRLKNSRVENGNLVIEVHKEDFMDGKYTSARLTTKNKGDWKYGRLEIKAKIPAGKGMWPAIWMLPTKMAYGIWPHSGEIDIMENVGYWPDSLFGTVHTGAYNGMKGTQKSGAYFLKDLSNDFHIYAVEWTKDDVRFFIDNKQYHQFPSGQVHTNDCSLNSHGL
jgi:beta-glucanase (GH16 family)